MVCHNCKCQCNKFGFHHGFQRYRCRDCGRTFSDIPERPLDSLRIPLDKAIQIIHLLVEGVGIRAIERLTQVHQDTVLNVLEVAGQKCARVMDEQVRNVPFEFVQVDELFAFVHCKEKNNTAHTPREFALEVREPAAPPVDVAYAFDVAFTTIGWLIPLTLFRRPIEHVLLRKARYEVEKNLSRLAADWRDRVAAGINELKGVSFEKVQITARLLAQNAEASLEPTGK